MLLEVSGLTTRYGSISALRDVSLSVGDGEVVGLIGPNGAGRTTLLNTVAGLLPPAVVGHGAGSGLLAETDLFDTFVRGSAA